jgi:uncharacterized membrane protein HdeD (DUF308 family)
VLAALALNWPFLLFRAALGVGFGLVILLWPGVMPTKLALLFGLYAFSDGVVALVLAVSVRDVAGFGSLFVEASIRAILALVVLASPAAAALKLVDIFTTWAFLSSASAFLVALMLRREVSGEWPLPFAGAVSLLFGVMLRLAPGPPRDLTWVIGPYLVLFGFTVGVLTLRLRRLAFEVSGS